MISVLQLASCSTKSDLIGTHAEGRALQVLPTTDRQGVHLAFRAAAKTPGEFDGVVVQTARDRTTLFLIAGADAPAIKPDGTQIAVHGLGGGVSIYDLRSGDLVERIGRGRFPAWSPDGERLAVSLDLPPDSAGVWIVELNGEGAWNAVRADGTMPTWSADGRRIAFALRTHDGRMSIWERNIESDDEVQLTSSSPGGEHRYPRYSWDDHYLLYGSSDGLVVRDMASGSERIVSSRSSEIPSAAWLGTSGAILVAGPTLRTLTEW